MDRTERLKKIERLLRERTVVPLQDFLHELEVSKATFKRDLEYLRDRLNAPIDWDRDAGGYRLGEAGVGEKYELPGLWFTATEVHALLTMQQLLGQLGPGLLAPYIAPFQERLRQLLDSKAVPVDAFAERVKILRPQARQGEAQFFETVVSAVLQRRRLRLRHYHRERDSHQEREVSPQRLLYYRDNWYLDAWCHLRQDLRRFALETLSAVVPAEGAVHEVALDEVQRRLDGGYGAFAGGPLHWAELEFAPERARWVSREHWHPDQQGELLADGRYRLRVPYGDPRELLMDIQRHLPQVSVLGPPALRAALADHCRAALRQLEAKPV
ncbi:YafY family protein [Massilia sp. TS11]|uniref:helix-turn-helix transcriptional regulator n=1 Tax=Massilia sp. TS11 TaxID=2908003 RepID=UPI001EDB0129|nr:WYL domain-containing protein [Massilia sp. TS11]MCG2583958.1 WYL domain-containing protein [Massilia sp. TS11]